MKNYTFIKARLSEPSEYAISQGYKAGSLIGSYIYKTDSHALATYQCRKDCPGYDDTVVLEAVTIDVEDERYKELYKVHERCGCVMNVYGW